MLRASDAINEIAAALAKAQGEMRNAVKGAENPHFRSRYADLADVWDAVREPLSRNGLAIVQVPSFADGRATVETMVMHTSGQWIAGALAAPVAKPDPQGVGSAITYLRRYSLAGMAGVAQDDDDGNAASEAQKPAQRKAPPKPPQETGEEASEKQTDLLAKLIKSHVFTDIERAGVEKRLAAGMTKARATEAIDWAQECIKVRKAKEAQDGAA
jgi:hypothetical protein